MYYACVLQRIVGKLYNAEQIKEWLMVPGPETGTEEGTRGVQDGSLAAIFILSAPFAMVKVSIFSFLVGLAIPRFYFHEEFRQQHSARRW